MTQERTGKHRGVGGGGKMGLKQYHPKKTFRKA